ncbi:MAG: hypothetical protein K2X90_03410 [Candidatus Babeliaceae bacterium]|nr:hypothetical protein [Candidatus Babeliaceae bacterium]
MSAVNLAKIVKIVLVSVRKDPNVLAQLARKHVAVKILYNFYEYFHLRSRELSRLLSFITVTVPTGGVTKIHRKILKAE